MNMKYIKTLGGAGVLLAALVNESMAQERPDCPMGENLSAHNGLVLVAKGNDNGIKACQDKEYFPNGMNFPVHGLAQSGQTVIGHFDSSTLSHQNWSYTIGYFYNKKEGGYCALLSYLYFINPQAKYNPDGTLESCTYVVCSSSKPCPSSTCTSSPETCHSPGGHTTITLYPPMRGEDRR
jgi:hypothetical protein